MSGSDIKEACREAAMVPVREYIKKARGSSGRPMKAVKGEQLRGLQTEDFLGMRNQNGGLGEPSGFPTSAADSAPADPGSASTSAAAAARRGLKEVENEVRSQASSTEEVVEYWDDLGESGRVDE